MESVVLKDKERIPSNYTKYWQEGRLAKKLHQGKNLSLIYRDPYRYYWEVGYNTEDIS